jgi:ketosteroid isomerase-like protein
MKVKMISACEQYFHALNKFDRQAYLACFTADAQLLDPYGARMVEGSDGLARWFKGMENTWSEFSVQPGEYYVSGNRCAVEWQAEATAKSGKVARFKGINIFAMTADGFISRLEAYWDAAEMMTQIS